jgi:exodeoxyribonuclease VIII
MCKRVLTGTAEDPRVAPMTLTDGTHKGIPFEDYLSWDAVGIHDLMLVHRSPAHFKAKKETPDKPTDAMRFGTAAHSWILTPDLAPSEVVVAPKVDRRTKVGKEQWADFEAMANGKTIVNEDEADTLSKMAGAVASSQAARNILDKCPLREVSFLRTVGSKSVGLRGRADAMSEDAKIIVDLKTTNNAAPSEFRRTAANFNYHAQCAFYMDNIRALHGLDEDPTFAFVVVEKAPPFGVAVYVLDEEAVEAGRKLYRDALTAYTACLYENDWPSYPASRVAQVLELPRWAVQ